jgi:hypothetical protein
LRRRGHERTIEAVESDALIYREELTGTLFTIADINAKIERIVELLEEELGGEGKVPEDDT